MALKHAVCNELKRRGIKTRFFCDLHNIKKSVFYQTIAGKATNRNVIKALYREGMLDMFLDEFPQLKDRVDDMFVRVNVNDD